jgi:hypothetical protein
MSFEHRLVAQRAPHADMLPRPTKPHMRLVQG